MLLWLRAVSVGIMRNDCARRDMTELYETVVLAFCQDGQEIKLRSYLIPNERGDHTLIP